MKKIIERFYPTWLVYDVLAITPHQLKLKQIDGILLDVDNTIIAWHDDTVPTSVKQWVDTLLKDNIGVVLLSNNRRGRIEKIAKQLGVPCVPNAKKPFQNGVLKGVSLLNIPIDNIVVIGDQLFTDILGGCVAGLKTILVKSISDSDMLPTKMIRYVEKRVLQRMRKKHHLLWREMLEK